MNDSNLLFALTKLKLYFFKKAKSPMHKDILKKCETTIIFPYGMYGGDGDC